MSVLGVPFLAFAAAGAVGLAYLAAAYLWRLLLVALASTLAVG